MGMGGIPPGAMEHMEHPTKAAWIPFAPALPTHGWTVTASTEAPGHRAPAVLGSRRAGYWQSGRLDRKAHLPQSITIRFPAAELVSGLTYVPRAGLGEVGRFRVTLSRDGKRFRRAVAYGTWQANASDKKVAWTAARVRAVRLTVLSVSPRGATSVAAARIVLTGETAGGRASAKVDRHGSCRRGVDQSVRRRPVGTDDRLPARPGSRGADSGQQARRVVGGRGPELRLGLVTVHADGDPGPHDRGGQRCNDQQHRPQHVLPGRLDPPGWRDPGHGRHQRQLDEHL